MSQGPYSAYKPSGIPWLGDVPEHWDVIPTGALLNLKKQLVGDRADKYTLLSLTKQGIIARDTENPKGKFPASFETYQVVEPGDLVFCLFDIDETPRTIGLSSMSGMITGAYTRFVCPNEQNRRFIYQLYLSLDNGKLLKPLYSGLRKVITKSTFLSATIPLPPLPEQRAIVRYLDHADRRIRRYVSAKRKLIGLLEEEKQAVINRAVTRGLDPDVRLKPSGVEWLGDVPEHWEVHKLRQCVSISGGMTPNMEVQRFWNGQVPWVTPKDMKQAVIGDSSVKTTDAAISETSLRLVKPPVVLMVVRGMILARRVPIAYTTVPVTINQDMKALRAVKGANARFLACSLASAQEAFVPLIDEAGHGTRRLPMERWRELPMAMPPPSEQTAIVEHLNKETAHIDSAIARARRQFELLQEYRTRLVADVITGKLDVREAAALLPDESEDEDPIDEDNSLEEETYEGSLDRDMAAEELAMESEVTV